MITTIDEYHQLYPQEVQDLLQQLRQAILQAAPKATETISYGMPAFKLNKVLVYYAAYKNHIGFYPTPSGIKAFQNEISCYKNSKGAVQFPLDKPIPYDLIQKMVLFRVEENRKKIKK